MSYRLHFYLSSDGIVHVIAIPLKVMGWKKRVRELADRKPDAVPDHVLDSLEPNRRRSWPELQPRAGRNFLLGVASVLVMAISLWLLASFHEINATVILMTLAIVSLPASGLFCLLGQTFVEDAVITTIILLLGLTFVWRFPLPWCLLPGFAAIIASIVNGTLKSTLGRYF